METIIMKGYYTPISDDTGIIGYNYHCPNCKYSTPFRSSDDGCKNCGFSEPFIEPDDWYDSEMKKPESERAWNKTLNG